MLGDDSGRFLGFIVNLDNSGLQQQADQAKNILRGIGTDFTRQGQRMDDTLSKIGKTIVGVFAADKLKDFAVHIATVRGQFQQLQVAFSTMLGSGRQAAQLMTQLTHTAATTPFSLTDIAQGAQQLLGYGFAADKVNQTLIDLGNIAAGLSIPLNDLVYLYGTTMVQGRMYTQDLRQFLNRGIPLVDALAKEFGVTKDQVAGLVEAGKVGFPQLETAIKSLTENGGKFAGLMDAQSKTITGQISNIEDSISMMFNDIGKQTEGTINDVLKGVQWAVDHWRELGKAILVVASAIGTYKAAVAAVYALAFTQKIIAETEAMIGLKTATQAAAVAQTALNAAATKAGPIGVIVGIIATAATAFGLFSQKTDEVADAIAKAGSTAAETSNKLRNLQAVINGTPASSDAYKNALQQLNSELDKLGVSEITAKDSIEQQNEKIRTAIALTDQMTASTMRLKLAEQSMDDYNKSYQDAYDTLYKRMKNASAVGANGPDEAATKYIQQNALAYTEIIAQTIQDNNDLIANKTGTELAKGREQLRRLIDENLRRGGLKYGIEDTTIYSDRLRDMFERKDNIDAFINSTQKAAAAEADVNRQANAAADAMDKAAASTGTFADRVAATKKQLLDASSDVATFADNIYKLLTKYGNNVIKFDVVYNDKTPDWMQKMSVDSRKQLAANYAAILEQMQADKAQNVMLDGKKMSLADVATRATQYAASLKNVKPTANSDNGNNSNNNNGSGTDDRQQLADEAEERAQAIRQYGKTVIEQEKQTALDIRQVQIDNMEDGYEKQSRQLKLNYDRLIEQNKEREQQMIKALADDKLNEWLQKHPKATRKQQDDYLNSMLSGPNALTRESLDATQQKQLDTYDKLADASYLQGQRQMFTQSLQQYESYEQKRQDIARKYAQARQTLEQTSDAVIGETIEGYSQMSAEAQKKAVDAVRRGMSDNIGKQQKQDLDEVNAQMVEDINKSSSMMIELFTNASDLSTSSLQKIITKTRELLDYLQKTPDENITDKFGFTRAQLIAMKANAQEIKEIMQQLVQDEIKMRQRNPFTQLASDFKAFRDAVKSGNSNEIHKTLYDLMNDTQKAASVIGSVLNDVSSMFEQTSSDAVLSVGSVVSAIGSIAQGWASGGPIGAAVSAIGSITGAIGRLFHQGRIHREALRKIRQEEEAEQRDYMKEMLSLREQAEDTQTVFGSLDYSKAKEQLTVMRDSYRDLADAIHGTTEQQQRLGEAMLPRQSVWQRIKNEIEGVQQQIPDVSDAGLRDIMIKTGHKKGGLFHHSKDLYSSILDVYPNLIDSQGKFNEALAKSIVESREFQGSGKEALQQMIDLYDQAKKASDDVKSYLQNIFGELGSNISDALSDAFVNGSDSAVKFGDSVKSMLENIGKQMVFSTLFDGIIKKASDKMMKTMENMNMSDEAKFDSYTDILDTLTSEILGKEKDYDGLMKKFKDDAAAKGIDIFGPDESDKRTATAKGIADVSQDSVDELNGRTTAIQEHTYSIQENTKRLVGTVSSILTSVIRIEKNTDDVPERLRALESDVKQTRQTINDIALKGIKLRG